MDICTIAINKPAKESNRDSAGSRIVNKTEKGTRVIGC